MGSLVNRFTLGQSLWGYPLLEFANITAS